MARHPRARLGIDRQCSSPNPRNLGAGHKEAAALVEAVHAGEVEIAAVHDASDAMNVQLDLFIDSRAVMLANQAIAALSAREP